MNIFIIFKLYMNLNTLDFGYYWILINMEKSEGEWKDLLLDKLHK